MKSSLVVVMVILVLSGLTAIAFSIPYVTRYPEAISTAGMGAGCVAMGLGALWTMGRYPE